MKAWKLLPGQPAELVEFTGEPGKFARSVIEAPLDFTRVNYEGRVRTMAVDDESAFKGLPVNEEATKAYRANCKPGTTWSIYGPAVIFDRVLS